MTRILHLSDTHVAADGRDANGVEAAAALVRMLHDARHIPELDAVIVTGDVADDGSAEGGAIVRDLVGAFAAERGIPQFYCTGNHDDRDGFRAALGTGHLGPDGTDRGTVLFDGSCAAVSDLAGLRFITLDSLVPGSTHGLLDAAQLGRLGDLLATPAPRGTVVMLHHPPLRIGAQPDLDAVVLQNIEDLAAVIGGTDVRAVLAGHLHFQLSGSLAGIPVSVAPGIVTRADTTAPPHMVRFVTGAGASVVEIPDDASPTFHTIVARDDRAGEQVYLFDVERGQRVATEE